MKSLLVLCAVLAACGGESESEGPQTAAQTEERESASTGTEPEEATANEACPSDEEISEVLGNPVQGKPWGPGCFYEAADFESSVAMMRIAASSADQVEREMRESAAPRGEELEAIDVGDRGQVWGAPGMGQGYAVSGDRGWMLDISTTSGGNEDRKAEVIQILQMMIG